MTDSHIYLSYGCYDQTFTYIDFDNDNEEYKLVANQNRESLICEMKRRGISRCIDPAIDVDSNAAVLRLIKLADQKGLPLILHIRMADEDAIRILRRYKKKLHGGVRHCFQGGPDFAKVYTEELGFCLGIGGALLRKPEISEQLEQAVIATPIEYLMLETDGPFVKPEKPEEITGKKWSKARNTSLILPAVADRIAQLKGMSADDVMRITEVNTRRVFRLVPGSAS